MNHITVFHQPNCQPCRLTMRMLDKLGATYVSRPLGDGSPEAEQATLNAKALGMTSAPHRRGSYRVRHSCPHAERIPPGGAAGDRRGRPMTRSLKPPEWEQYPLRTAELCAGYGGLSLSVGDKHPSWVSEVDPHASRVLRDRFPYSPNGGQHLSARFVEWVMGLPRGWVTGMWTLPRSAQIRILGNGVVPQQGRLAVNTLAGRALEVLS